VVIVGSAPFTALAQGLIASSDAASDFRHLGHENSGNTAEPSRRVDGYYKTK
jgi:hypothetical protein